jgi:hypothetical protein
VPRYRAIKEEGQEEEEGGEYKKKVKMQRTKWSSNT